jgi:hypothetical protein
MAARRRRRSLALELQGRLSLVPEAQVVESERSYLQKRPFHFIPISCFGCRATSQPICGQRSAEVALKAYPDRDIGLDFRPTAISIKKCSFENRKRELLL